MPTTESGLRFDHLERMLTDLGLWQHTEGDTPNSRHGYSIDDEARGLIVGLRYWQQGVAPELNARMAATCFTFLETAALTEGAFAGFYHNFCDAEGHWLDSLGSEDSFGRTLWGLGVAHQVDAPFAPRKDAATMLTRSLPRVDELHFLRSKAFAMLGLAYSRQDDARLRRLADDLAEAYERTAGDGWNWFENGMTYCNARLPHALFVAAGILPDAERYIRAATGSLDFLLSVTRNGKGSYSPIGNRHLTARDWFLRGELRPPQFDQQPVDAGVLVEACAEAFIVTGEPRFRQASRDAFAWYFGQNVHNLPVYNPQTGGVADALTRSGLNRNQGAESVLSIHLAQQALQRLD